MSDERQRADAYLEAAARHEAERSRRARQSRMLSWARLAVFLAAAALTLSIFPGPVSHAALRLGLGSMGFAIFAVLVGWHSRIDDRERWSAMLARVNTEAAARVRRDWTSLPLSPVVGPGPEHAYADDLDIFGHGSLFQLLGGASTDPGRATLSAWLTAPASPSTIRERQAAVAELAAMRTAREEFSALGRTIDSARYALDGLIEWAEAGPWFTRRRWASWALRALTVTQLGLLSAHVAGVIERPLWIYTLALSLVVCVAFGKRTAQTFTRVFSRSGLIQRHADLFARIDGASFSSTRLRALQAQLRSSGLSAERELARLARISQFADLRLIALFWSVIHPLTLWDFHVLAALEGWQRRTGPQLRRWYDSLGEFDALSALAGLAHDNPSWTFPTIVEDSRAIDARELGHPLIVESRRIANDVRVGPPGRFLMVTGSNMSGKSTLLRAVGVNVVLAQAGGPVCAASLVMPPVAICTSMRVEDSLEEGVSYFMAALRRLKLVVASARATGPGDPLLLYLLDEVLQGTNTAERQVAVRRIVHHLLTLRAIGVVTTHDLELAACEELAGTFDAVHFSEAVDAEAGGARLTFDYRLKPGIATSRNALKLLQIVGLDG